MPKITRFGVSMDAELLDRFDGFVSARGYANRSEAVRDMVRERLVQEEWKDDRLETVGTITLIYDHHRRELTERLTGHQHRSHHRVISTLHVHLDERHCLEVLAVRGRAADLRELADRLIGTKGVKHGKLVMTSSGKNL